MRAITKTFPGVVALKDVSLEARAGEVLALMGENGAGKSTLMKILGGAYEPDSGEIRIDDKPVQLRGVRDAQRHGIRLIHQELMLAQNLDIAANLFLGSEPGSRRMLRRLPRREMAERARQLLPRVGLDVSPETRVASLTAGQLQMVEIAKALALEARIIIMDEPTSSLTHSESEHLFRIIGELQKTGIAIIYISHRLEEVMRLADRISVLRDGRHVGDVLRKDAHVDRIVQMMVGREMTGQYFPKREARPPGEVVLDVQNLVVPGSPVGVSFQALRGEILGFAGLVGAGRTELMATLFGVTPALAGSVTLAGEPFAPRHPRDAIARGVFLAPEDRKRHGLIVRMSVAQNASLPSINGFNRWGLLERKKEQRLADAEVKRLRIKTRNIHQKVMNLSGGNQQKIVLGKWLALSPKLLMLDEPTRGIDVGAKAEIYQHMANLAASGITILMVSSDLEEILGMSDRVLVMHERHVRGILAREEISVERIATLMTGAKQSAPATAAAASLLTQGGLAPRGEA
jgi:ribose transport system ATP-binding protein